MTAAGYAAQNHLDASLGDEGCKGDDSYVVDLAYQMCLNDNEAVAWQQRIYARAAAMVAVRWPYIEAVAAALIQRRGLRSQEFREVIAAASEKF